MVRACMWVYGVPQLMDMHCTAALTGIILLLNGKHWQVKPAAYNVTSYLQNGTRLLLVCGARH